ncbi:MAG: ribonucleotide reductase N-terminal alpha domain-containing protein, partial [Desulfatitalea sp.]
MGRKAKLIETKEGVIDMATYSWDEERFSRVLIAQHPMDDQQAAAISRFVREAIEELKIHRVPSPIVEAVVRATLDEHGVPQPVQVPLNKSLFVRNGLRLSDNARKVLERRYLRKDPNGKPLEKPAQMFRRVARHIAQAELTSDPQADTQAVEECFYELMTDLKFLPNSPTLMNAGRRLGQLAACF